MPKKPRFKIASVGCRTNQYEVQAYRDQLIQMGYLPADDGEQADLCIVNTCTVTEAADSSSRHEIRQLAKRNPGARLVVTGCSVERQRKKLLEIEGVTDLIPNIEKEDLVQKILPEGEAPEFAIKNFDSHTRAFVKVQDGCNAFCSYCIIPYVRGRSRSRAIGDVVREVEGLVANGYKEVVLTGINIGDFEGELSDLVRAVDQVSGLERLRISSIDPNEINDDLMDAVLNGRTTCHSMHIVLQSGSNVILKRMNRKYTRQVFMDAIEKLQGASPDFTFTTDVIVGFPGETDVDFQETLEVIKEVRFIKVHMFPYSSRPKTRAALFPNHISPEVIRERKQEVLRISEQVAFDLRERFVSRRMTVLTENSDDLPSGEVTGHTENFLSVIIKDSDIGPNTLVDVDLVENASTGLIGQVLRCESP